MAELDLSEMFTALAELLETGSEDIAATGARALRRHANASYVGEVNILTTGAEISSLLTMPAALPCAATIAPIVDRLSWHYSGYDDGRISADVALRMQTVELIGADGMIYDATCRVGLFAQTAQTNYIIRTHSAEELFVQIAGEAEWCKGDEPYAPRHPGDRMHHQSYQPHASRTGQSGLIAVWVWSGDLDYKKYNYVGCNAAIPENNL
ncbi:MAG: dimethylsulfonioproprionate lyase family protein [Rhizobiaceae bacterium]